MRNLTRQAATCLLAVFAVSAMADEASALQKRIQAAMNKYTAAVMKKDMKTADKVITDNFAEDCKFKEGGKTMTREEWLKDNDAQIGAMKSITKFTLNMANVQVKGSKATGTTLVAIAGTVPNPKDPKKVSRMSYRGKSRSVFEKRNGKWVCVSDTSMGGQAMVDGKTVKVGS